MSARDIEKIAHRYLQQSDLNPKRNESKAALRFVLQEVERLRKKGTPWYRALEVFTTLQVIRLDYTPIKEVSLRRERQLICKLLKSNAVAYFITRPLWYQQDTHAFRK